MIFRRHTDTIFGGLSLHDHLLGLVDILLGHMQSKDQLLLLFLQSADLQFQILDISLERTRTENLQMKLLKLQPEMKL